MHHLDTAQELLEIEAIKALKARYCRFSDAADLVGYRSLFTDDATFDCGYDVIYGADAFVERSRVHRARADIVTVHQCSMPEIELTGEDTARGTWAMTDYLDRIWKADGIREAYRGWGYYEEEYAKADGTWRISRWRIRRLRIDWTPADQLPPFPRQDDPTFNYMPIPLDRLS